MKAIFLEKIKFKTCTKMKKDVKAFTFKIKMNAKFIFYIHEKRNLLII